ncbi:MAG: tetratricopeptide repeat protein [Treponema sp.]|nr:tetratricopeptide repeat protein [Treponema sp.]
MQKVEKENFGEKINNFVQKNRKGIFVVFGLFIVLFVGFIVYFLVSDHLNKQAIAEVEILNEEFEKLRFGLFDDYYANEVNILLSKMEVFAGNNKGFAGSKAWSNVGHIYSARKQWNQAEEAWVKSAEIGVKTYLGPIAYFNAAICAEEQGKLEKAIEYLRQSISHKFEFPDAPRAQFNIGRLYEQLGNYPEALAEYRAVLINYPWDRQETISQNMLIWQNLARNQIIKLESR